MLRTPLVGNPNRWWGVPVAVPTGVDPVFEIPWHNWKARERLAFKEYRSHIDIHAYTVRVPKSFHAWLHSGGPDGGQWTDAPWGRTGAGDGIRPAHGQGIGTLRLVRHSSPLVAPGTA
nr:DUF2380 domain-containing protein [Archangium violaceum]